MNKKIVTAFLIATSLAASAQAVIIGLDAGYLLDSEEEYVSARLGVELRAAGPYSHQVEIEVGFSQAEESGAKGDLLPATLNYRFAVRGPQRVGFHLGLGAGVARTRIDGVSTGGPVRFSDTSLVAQGFGGLTFQVSPTATLSLGARYLWIDDADFGFGSVEVGDDVAITAGLSFKF